MRVSSARTNSAHGASGGAPSSSARQIATASFDAPVLLGGEPEEEARLDVLGVERDRGLELRERFRRHDAVRRRRQRLAESRHGVRRVGR